MNSPIYPMTFIPKKRNFKLYYLAFPKPWKELLIQLQVSAYKKYDPEYYMKLFGLKACLNGWLDEVVNVGNMKANSDDSRWFVSLNEPDVHKICKIMKIWVTAEYELNDKATSETKAIAEKFKSEIDPDVLRYGITSEEVAFSTRMALRRWTMPLTHLRYMWRTLLMERPYPFSVRSLRSAIVA